MVVRRLEKFLETVSDFLPLAGVLVLFSVKNFFCHISLMSLKTSNLRLSTLQMWHKWSVPLSIYFLVFFFIITTRELTDTLTLITYTCKYTSSHTHKHIQFHMQIFHPPHTHSHMLKHNLCLSPFHPWDSLFSFGYTTVSIMSSCIWMCVCL